MGPGGAYAPYYFLRSVTPAMGWRFPTSLQAFAWSMYVPPPPAATPARPHRYVCRSKNGMDLATTVRYVWGGGSNSTTRSTCPEVVRPETFTSEKLKRKHKTYVSGHKRNNVRVLLMHPTLVFMSCPGYDFKIITLASVGNVFSTVASTLHPSSAGTRTKTLANLIGPRRRTVPGSWRFP